MALLMVARAIHGAAVGSIVVAGAAALLDLRPEHGVRSGQLSGVSFNIGMTVAIVGSALLAQYAPHPMRTPYAVVAVICAVVGVGVIALREPHSARTRGPIRIARPAVPREIRGDFWFAALGAMASWSVLGVLLSLYPSLAAQQTHVHNLVFGGVVVGTTAFSAALAQMFATRMPARRAAIIGDVGHGDRAGAHDSGIGHAQLAIWCSPPPHCSARRSVSASAARCATCRTWFPPIGAARPCRRTTCSPTRRWRCRPSWRAGRRPGGR